MGKRIDAVRVKKKRARRAQNPLGLCDEIIAAVAIPRRIAMRDSHAPDAKRILLIGQCNAVFGQGLIFGNAQQILQQTSRQSRQMLQSKRRVVLQRNGRRRVNILNHPDSAPVQIPARLVKIGKAHLLVKCAFGIGAKGKHTCHNRIAMAHQKTPDQIALRKSAQPRPQQNRWTLQRARGDNRNRGRHVKRRFGPPIHARHRLHAPALANELCDLHAGHDLGPGLLCQVEQGHRDIVFGLDAAGEPIAGQTPNTKRARPVGKIDRHRHAKGPMPQGAPGLPNALCGPRECDGRIRIIARSRGFARICARFAVNF